MKNEISIRAAVYLRAAELVELKGITKGTFGYDGTRCGVGYLLDAAREIGVNIIDIDPSMSHWGLVSFNDHPDTTAAMVAAKLREQAFGD